MPAPSQRDQRRVRGRNLSSSPESIPHGGIAEGNSGVPAKLNGHLQVPFRMKAEELFLANVATIDRIAAFICRQHHVADDWEEFAAQVKLDIIDRNYEIIRKYEARAQFSTYLTTVMHRLFYQYRVKLWGKWRPSAEAKRLGNVAIALEKLLTRDNYSFSEAARMMGDRTVVELEAIY